jgi:hypothetical protein
MKKAQMTVFLMVGFIMFVLVAIIFGSVAMMSRENLQKNADKVADALFDSTSVKTYIDTCVAQVSKSVFKEISESGGFIYNLTDKNNVSITDSIPFLDYYNEDGEQVKTAYALQRGTDDYGPYYPCPLFGSECGGPGTSFFNPSSPGIHFCNYSFSNSDKIQTCTYGQKAPLVLELTNTSLKHQLEEKISQGMKECVNISYFEELGFEMENVGEGEVKTEVVFGRDAITFNVDFPFVVSFSDSQSVKTSRFSYILDIDFKKMFDVLLFGSNSVFHKEYKNIDTDIMTYAESQIILNNLDYQIDQKVNINFKDDLYTITHGSVSIDGEPYQFIFAVGNRVPVLDLVDYALENPDCEIYVPPGTNVTIQPLAKDPDDDEELTFIYAFTGTTGWTQQESLLHKIVSEADDGSEINILVSDGQYNDSQIVRVCVDPYATLEYEPSVELLYPYEGFDVLYFDTVLQEKIPIITTEDPIKLQMGTGFRGKGTWTVGSCDEEVTSSCVIFPGWTDCSEGFSIPLYSESSDDISDYYEDCDVTPGAFDIYFEPEDEDTIIIPVNVTECVPHRDISGVAKENVFMETHSCCIDFKYAGSSFTAAEQEQLICGNPVGENLASTEANDVFIMMTVLQCHSDRGNVYDTNSVDGTQYFSTREIVDSDTLGGRRCMGCGEFMSFTNNITQLFDFSKRDIFQDTFESYFLKDADVAEDPYLCDPNYACVSSLSGTSRGKYDPGNVVSNPEKEPGRMKCQAACNYGRCDYAVNCICSRECGLPIANECDNKEIGALTGTCTDDPFGEDYYPDVCGDLCQISDIQDDIVFKCDSPLSDSDCVYCDTSCDGRRPGEELPTCEFGNTGVIDRCNEEGRVEDKLVNGKKQCVYNPGYSCLISPECDGVFVGEPIVRLDGTFQIEYGVQYYADTCNDECTIADSTTCSYQIGKNDISPLCNGYEVGEGFDYIGKPETKDAFCNKQCSFFSCGNFAYKGGALCEENPSSETCCYQAYDNVDLDVKCNIRNPINHDCDPE